MKSCQKLTQHIQALAKSSISSVAYTYRRAHSTHADCCQVCDKRIQECRSRVLKTCNPLDSEKSCYSRAEMYTKAIRDYPQQLLTVLRGQVPDCEVVRHDACYYRPSNKNRSYQRTWSECPFIWLRPKRVCCYENEVCPPTPRRPRQPVSFRTISPQEKFWLLMNQFCKMKCRVGHPPALKCSIKNRVRRKCEKVRTPFPSFSECDQKDIRPLCDGECSCSLMPSKCEAWREFHKNKCLLKKCTEAIVRKSAHRWRSISLH